MEMQLDDLEVFCVPMFLNQKNFKQFYSLKYLSLRIKRVLRFVVAF